jgi:hypothetical protein
VYVEGREPTGTAVLIIWLPSVTATANVEVGVVTAPVGIVIMDVGVIVGPPTPGVALTIGATGVPDRASAVWVAKLCTSAIEVGPPNVGANKLSSPTAVVAAGGVE